MKKLVVTNNINSKLRCVEPENVHTTYVLYDRFDNKSLNRISLKPYQVLEVVDSELVDRDALCISIPSSPIKINQSKLDGQTVLFKNTPLILINEKYLK